MSFSDYWARKKRANDALVKCVSMKMSIEVFRHELEKAYERGRQDGLKEGSGGLLGSAMDIIFGKPASK